jgi:MFS family permease
LFALNSEVAGVCLVVIAMVLLLAADPQNGGAYRPWLVIVAAGVLGLTANVHTYGFFAGAVLAMAYAATLALFRSRSRRLLVVTLVLVSLALLLGPTVARTLGPLPVIAFVLLAFTPAASTLARGHVATTVAMVAAYTVCASPQLVRTAVGLAQGDPFLTFRQVSSSGLGVAIPSGMLAAAPLILLGAVCCVALWGQGQTSKSALVSALAVGVLLMSQNDRWGFNQEPYRFWIIFTTLTGLLLSPVLAWSFAQRGRLVGHKQFALTGFAAMALVVWAISLVDTVSFVHSVHVEGVFSLEDGRSDATRSILGGREGLVVSSACMEPQVLKVTTGQQVAHYNRGLAWPTDVKEFYRFLEPKHRAAEDPRQLQAANVRWVLSDSSCSTDWAFDGDGRVAKAATSTYDTSHGQATITLWRVQSR